MGVLYHHTKSAHCSSGCLASSCLLHYIADLIAKWQGPGLLNLPPQVPLVVQEQLVEKH